MELNYETIVELKVLSAALSLEFLKNSIKLKPRISWKKGEKNPHTQREYDNHGFIFDSGLARSTDVENQVATLLKKLKPYEKKMKKLSKKAEVIFTCIQYIRNDFTPQFYFTSKDLESITKLGASLYLDLYILGKSKD